MLASAKLVAFVTVSNAARARTFYRDVLGLRLVSEDNFALVFDANGTVAWFKDPDGNLLSVSQH